MKTITLLLVGTTIVIGSGLVVTNLLAIYRRAGARSGQHRSGQATDSSPVDDTSTTARRRWQRYERTAADDETR